MTSAAVLVRPRPLTLTVSTFWATVVLMLAGIGLTGCSQVSQETGSGAQGQGTSGAVSAVAGRSSGPACGAVIGQWAWFTGGIVTVKPDGTIVHTLGNDGTWTCTDAARGAVTIKWRVGGFVNQMVPSADGRTLSSTDPAQMYVTATRAGGGPARQSSQPARERTAARGTTKPPSADTVDAIVARIDSNYRNTRLFASFLGEYVAIGQSVRLENKSVLVFASRQCDDTFAPGGQFKSFAEMARDCDQGRGGMKWKDSTIKFPLSRENAPTVAPAGESMDPSAGYAVAVATSNGNSNWSNVVGCGEKARCNQMLLDIRRLIDMLRG